MYITENANQDGQLFSAFKDAAYFSKVSGLCLKSFGIDQIPLSKAMNGELLEITTKCRNEGRPIEEAATRCIAAGLRFLTDRVDIPSGNSPDHKKLAKWSTIVDGWMAQGLIKANAHGEFRDSILYVLDEANRK